MAAANMARLPPFVKQNDEKGLTLVGITDTDMDEALSVIVASFSGSESTAPEPGLDWALGPLFKQKWDDENRLEFFRYFQKWCMTVAVNYGMLLGVRSKEGHLLAVVVLLPPGNAYAADTTCPQACCSSAFCSAVARMGNTPIHEKTEVFGPDAEKRMDMICAAMKQSRTENVPEDHWYVYTMAVSPQAQGKGCCRFALDAVSALADLDKVDCYLETTGERNIAVYERLGYKHAGEYELRLPVSEDTNLKDDSGNITLTTMVRPANSS